MAKTPKPTPEDETPVLSINPVPAADPDPANAPVTQADPGDETDPVTDAAATAPVTQADPGDETDLVTDAAATAEAKAGFADALFAPSDPLPGPFPTAALMQGHRARRAAWAPGYELMATDAGGRSGARMRLMTTGSRGGPIEWKPQHLADELLAQDWLVVLAVEPMP